MSAEIRRREVILDCDPGIDDALALFAAVAEQERLDLRAVTTVAGNVSLDGTTRNARGLLHLAGADDVPVYSSCGRPILAPGIDASNIHGDNGLGGLALAGPVRPLAVGHAVDRIRTNLDDTSRQTTLVAVGPLTNVALAIVSGTPVNGGLEDLVVMGGSADHGNVTPAAEFNFHVDPHAASIVMGSGLPVLMVGLDVTRTVRADPEWIRMVSNRPGPVSAATAAMLAPYMEASGALRDVAPRVDRAPGVVRGDLGAGGH